MTPAVGYTEMRDSGIEWVGMIPKDWDINILFQLVSQVKNKNKDLAETNLLSLSYGKIKRKNIDHTDGLIPASFDSYNIIDTGDIVLRLTDLQNDQTSLRVGRSTEKGIITSAYITLRPVNHKTSKFLYYLLHAFDIRKGFYGMGAGVRQGLTYDEVKVLKLPLPSISEQTAIATYLDTQCAKIDEIIAEVKASIEDYKQWKASIIYEAVTKGLDPKAEMKDSGISSFGKIPALWEIYRFQILCKLRSEDNSGGRELLSVYLDRGVIKYSDSSGMQVHKPSDSLEKYQNVYVNDFVMNNQQAWRGSVGVSKYNGIVSPAYHVYELSEDCFPQYMSYLLRDSSMVQQYELASRGVGTIQRNIYEPWLRKSYIALPTLAEQAVIAAYLDAKCAKIDMLVKEKQGFIIDLESYKKSLIYEVVTGKRRVC